MITAAESCQIVHTSILASEIHRIPNLLYTDYKCDQLQHYPPFTLSPQINLNALVENILHTVQNQTKNGVILFYDSHLGKFLAFKIRLTS